MRFVRGFGRFWFDFLIGDDWRIAAGVAAVLGAGAVLVRIDALDDTLVMLLVGAALIGVVVASVVSAARASRFVDNGRDREDRASRFHAAQ